uniref:Transcription initiation factor TFIID subunit 11-like n=1 Tax=Crassostrea virginica TaxID=6565 RepID=A0A8B8A6H3_CRAVI|nr:transcription initiation factor TFIID subunit 11-like [Crassostrea virginica]
MSGVDRKGEPLPILGEDGAVFQYGDQKRIPPQNGNKSQNRRTPTPTKQVNLKSINRRDDSPGYGETVDMEELRQSLSRENSRIYEPQLPEGNIHGTNSKTTRNHNCASSNIEENKRKPFVVSSNVSKPPLKSVKAPPKPQVKPTPEGATGGVDEEEESSSDSDEEEEERKAPSQLLMEFLECVMKKEYTVAAKLCKMILIYEPNHPTALQFQPVLEEKILLDQEKENESGSGESDDEDDESDDSGEDSDDDSDDDDSDDTEKEEEENEENEEDRNSADDFFDEFKEDSGIASAASD